MMPSQLSSDNLRNVRQALLMYNFLDILPAITHLYPDHGLGRLFTERISRIGQREDVSFADKNSVQRGRRLKDLSIQLEELPSCPGSSGINNSTSFALTIIAPNVVLKELLGSAKRARKTVRALMEA